MFRIWYGPPPSSPGNRVTNVVFPICISTVDPRFAFAVLTPVQPDGVATQPGFVYLRRVHTGYRVLGQLLSAATADDRPLGVSKQVHREFEPGGGYGTCTYQGGVAVLQAKRDHKAPVFIG